MTINMLKAISKMLEKGKDDTLETRVSCAKIMLDEVIKGLEKEPPGVTVTATYGADDEEAAIPSKPEPKPKPKPLPPKDKPYRVVVDADRKITKIEGLDLDAPVILDGITMKHKDAIGKKFTKVSLP